jgi:hypothetical protein
MENMENEAQLTAQERRRKYNETLDYPTGD